MKRSIGLFLVLLLAVPILAYGDSVDVIPPLSPAWTFNATDVFIRSLQDSIAVLESKLAGGRGSEKWCTFYQGGFFSSYNTLREGKRPSVTWAVRGARQIYSKIWLRGSFERVEGEGFAANNYPGELILHTRDPTGRQFQLYGVMGGALAHPIAESDTVSVVYGWSLGLGVLIPFGETIDATVEAQAKAVENDIVAVLWFGFRLLGP
jgi:hypothetical protein